MPRFDISLFDCSPLLCRDGGGSFFTQWDRFLGGIDHRGEGTRLPRGEREKAAAALVRLCAAPPAAKSRWREEDDEMLSSSSSSAPRAEGGGGGATRVSSWGSFLPFPFFPGRARSIPPPPPPSPPPRNAASLPSRGELTASLQILAAGSPPLPTHGFSPPVGPAPRSQQGQDFFSLR